MRNISRLLASVKPARFLESGNPTGLTGLFTHATPRSTLLYLYSFTIDKLKAIPEDSVYRQSVERIAQHRMNIVESIKPKGYDEWAERAKKMVEEHPDIFKSTTPGPYRVVSHGGPTFVVTEQKAEEDERVLEWDGEDQRSQGGNGENQPPQWVDEEHKDGEKTSAGTLGEPRFAAEKGAENVQVKGDQVINHRTLKWEPEPQLEASQ